MSQLRDCEFSYRQLFDNMAEGFALHEIITDDSGKVIDFRFLAANPAFDRHTGMEGRAIIGKTMLEVVPGADRHRIEAYGRVALTGKALTSGLKPTYAVSSTVPANSSGKSVLYATLRAANAWKLPYARANSATACWQTTFPTSSLPWTPQADPPMSAPRLNACAAFPSMRRWWSRADHAAAQGGPPSRRKHTRRKQSLHGHAAHTDPALSRD
jgi:PAS domain S-box-containing protein